MYVFFPAHKFWIISVNCRGGYHKRITIIVTFQNEIFMPINYIKKEQLKNLLSNKTKILVNKYATSEIDKLRKIFPLSFAYFPFLFNFSIFSHPHPNRNNTHLNASHDNKTVIIWSWFLEEITTVMEEFTNLIIQRLPFEQLSFS